MTVKIKKDLRHLFGPVRDQGQRPTCLAFAASDTHAALRGAWEPLSCEYIFFHAQRRAGRTAKDGATLPSMLQALRQDGQPHEAGWPYLLTLPADLSQWRPPASAAPLYRRAGDPGADTVDAVIAELDRNRPVLTLITLSRSFDWIGADGIVDPGPTEQPEYLRRHAVVAVGHGEAKGQRAVLIRNSWGSGWGHSGYGWLTEKFLVPRVFRIAILKEDIGVSCSKAAA
jgi:Papain family cysteine protease